MQNFESYGLMGTKRLTTAPVPDTLADSMVRRALDEIRQRDLQAVTPNVSPAPTPRSVRPAPVIPVTRGFERRPAGTVGLEGGAARRRGGGELAWAMREIRSMTPAERRSFAGANRELLRQTVAKLDREIAELSREQRDGRSSC